MREPSHRPEPITSPILHRGTRGGPPAGRPAVPRPAYSERGRRYQDCCLFGKGLSSTSQESQVPVVAAYGPFGSVAPPDSRAEGERGIEQDGCRSDRSDLAGPPPVSFQTNGEDSGDPRNPEVRDDRRLLEQPRRRDSSTEERANLGQTETQERIAGRVGPESPQKCDGAQQGQTDGPGAGRSRGRIEVGCSERRSA